jgi:hypothetical protein
MSAKKVNPTNLAVRLASVFVSSAVPNVLVGAALGVDAWKSAVMAGGVATLTVIYALATAFKKDGSLDLAEIEKAFAEAEAPKKKAPAKKPAAKKPAAKKTAK